MTFTPPPAHDDLAAGRELDALVAEKVMGLTNVGINNSWCANYSTDIGAAWQIIEKLRERFPQIDVEILPDRVTVTLWEQCRHDGGALDPLDEVEADTAPLAICRVALAAVSAS